MRKDPLILVEHVLESIEKIEEYTAGVTKEEFLESTLLQDAVIRRLEVIGEAIKNIPMEVKARYPDIPWREIVGMRDVLIHKYFGVDLELTWIVIKRDLPALKRRMLEIKRDLERKRLGKR